MPTKQLTAEERRQRTVEAVVSLSGTRNPSDITTAAIAEQMGVTQGALFRHFPSKDAIFEAVMTWVAERLLDRIERAAKRAPTPLAALDAMFMSHLSFVVDHPGVPRMMFGELQHPGQSPAKRVAQRLLERYAARLATTIDEGKAIGEIRADLDTRAAAVLFIGTIQGLVMQSMISGNVRQARQRAPDVFAIFAKGVSSSQQSGSGAAP